MARPSGRARLRRAVFWKHKVADAIASNEARQEQIRVSKELGHALSYASGPKGLRQSFASLSGTTPNALLSAKVNSHSNAGSSIGKTRIVEAEYREKPSKASLVATKGGTRVYTCGEAKGALKVAKQRPQFEPVYNGRDELVAFRVKPVSYPVGFQKERIEGTGREERVLGTDMVYIDGPTVQHPNRSGRFVEVERSCRSGGFGQGGKASQERLKQRKLKAAFGNHKVFSEQEDTCKDNRAFRLERRNGKTYGRELGVASPKVIRINNSGR